MAFGPGEAPSSEAGLCMGARALRVGLAWSLSPDCHARGAWRSACARGLRPRPDTASLTRPLGAGRAAVARPSPEGGLGVMQAAPCAWLYVFAAAGPAVRVAFDGHGGLLFLPFLRPGSCELHPVRGEQASACWRELGSICRPLGEALNFKAPHRAPQTGSCGRQSRGRNRPSSPATLSTWR